jgi:hypothetical protein
VRRSSAACEVLSAKYEAPRAWPGLRQEREHRTELSSGSCGIYREKGLSHWNLTKFNQCQNDADFFSPISTIRTVSRRITRSSKKELFLI